MAKEYIKESDYILKEAETKNVEKLYDLKDLKDEKVNILNNISSLNVRVEEIDALISEADKLGIIERG